MKRLILLVCLGAALTVAGENVKIKIFVDKVFSRNKTRELSEDSVRQIAEAGFNVLCPRWHGKDVKKMELYSNWAKKYNMDFMVWFRGTLKTDDDNESFVYADGTKVGICSPISKRYWEYLEKWILTYAKVSSRGGVSGLFLDFEMYARPKLSNAFLVSYDKESLKLFGKYKNINIPGNSPVKFLEQNKLREEYIKFVKKVYQENSRKLRKKIDAINPKFQILIYNGTNLVANIFSREMSTPEAPLIMASSSTYSLDYPVISPRLNLISHRNKILDNISARRPYNYSFKLLGGIDPAVMLRTRVKPVAVEFSAKNAAAICSVTDGYWVFYEGMRPDSDEHREHMKWFRIVNKEIDRGRTEIWEEPFTSKYVPIPKEHLKQDDTDKIKVGLFGIRGKHIKKFLASDGTKKIYDLQFLEAQYLKQFAFIILQNFNVSLQRGSEVHQELKKYVSQGGAIFFTHDSGWFFRSPFPLIAERGFPKFEATAFRHVVSSKLYITKAGEKLFGIKKGKEYLASFYDHMIFNPGIYGKTLIRNKFGDAVVVVGEYGKGKVVFSGCFYGYRNAPVGTEKETLQKLMKYVMDK